MQRRQRLIVIGLIALIVASAVVAGYLFRRQTYDNPELGVITYHYRWGKRAWLTADTNRDGKIDVRDRIDDLGFPEEYWEDSNYDGSFDRHVVMEGSLIQRVELDEDGDGKYERVLEGAEAQGFYRQSQSGKGLMSEPRQHPLY
jgi:hypothetical protein